MSEEDGWKSFFLDRRSRGAVEEVMDVARVLAGDGSVMYNLLKLHLGWRDLGDPQEEVNRSTVLPAPPLPSPLRANSSFLLVGPPTRPPCAGRGDGRLAGHAGSAARAA